MNHIGSCLFLVSIMWTAVFPKCFRYVNCFVFLEISKRTTVRICYSLCGPICASDIYNSEIEFCGLNKRLNNAKRHYNSVIDVLASSISKQQWHLSPIHVPILVAV